MGKWQLLDYPNERTLEAVAASAVRRVLAGKPAYLLHDQVVYTMTMNDETRPDGTRERTLVLQPSAAIGGGEPLAEGKKAFRSPVIVLPAFNDAGAGEQVAGLLTERAGQAFLDQVEEEIHN